MKIIYNSSESYEQLLTRSNEVTIYEKHLRALPAEIYKYLADINPHFMKPYFKIKEMPYDLQNGNALKLLSAIPRFMESTQFCSEHVYCGIDCHSL